MAKSRTGFTGAPTDGKIVAQTVRLPAELHERIASEAAANRRSFNSEVIFQMEKAYD